jgi:uncharacterized protein (TIGR03663 family)
MMSLGSARRPVQAWAVMAAAVFLVAAVLRLWDLPLVPFHNDEGVSGWFIIQILRHGTWTYDPGVYFGPTPYYAGALWALLLGLNDTALRLVPAAFGLATIALVLGLRRYIGAIGSIVAAALLTVSTGWLYYSRAFFAEELLLFFTLALAFCAWRWSETGQNRFLLFGAIAAALLFTTKSTSYIAVAVLILSAICLRLYERFEIGGRLAGLRLGGPPAIDRRRRLEGEAAGRKGRSSSHEARPTAATPARAGSGDLVISIPRPFVAAFLLFGVIYVTLFSSFFTNPQGVFDALGTLGAWLGTAGTTHLHPLTQYVEWGLAEEAPIVALFAIGGVLALLGGRSRFAIFATFWAGGIFTAYSLISYKEPWLMLNFVVPMAIVGGYGIEALWQLGKTLVPRLVVVGAVAAVLGFSTYSAVQLSFVNYDDDRNAYVYVHTTRDLYHLLDAVSTTEAELPSGDQTAIAIVSPDYWPLPWYWRDNPNAGFWGQMVDGPLTDNQAALIIANVNQAADLTPRIAGRYDLLGQFNLRPGVDLAVYVRSDVPRR